MLPLIIAVCGAAGAVVGALTTHAVGEKDRQAAKRYKRINAELINSKDNLQQRYYELSDKSKEQINGLNLKLAESEIEKDALHLAVRLQNELISLMESININPSLEILAEFKKAVVLTNYVLEQLNESLVPISQDYFSRALIRVDRSHDYEEEELVYFMSVLMNPPQDTVANLLNEVQDDIFPQQEIVADENNTSNFQVQAAQNTQEDYVNKDNLRNDFIKNQNLKISEAVIEILDDVPGITACRESLVVKSRPKFTLKNGAVIKTWTNRMVGGDHVFLVDSDGTMIYGGFVWRYDKELKQAIKKIKKEFA